jgi:hypothetical protein
MQVHKPCEISVLKRPFFSSLNPDAVKTYCINKHGDDGNDDADIYLDTKIHVACTRHRNREC